MLDNMLMELQKVMVSTTGKMEARTRVISVTELDMDTEFGKTKTKLILDLTRLIIKKDLESIHGKIKKCTRDNLRMITETDMVRCLVSIVLPKS